MCFVRLRSLEHYIHDSWKINPQQWSEEPVDDCIAFVAPHMVLWVHQNGKRWSMIYEKKLQRAGNHIRYQTNLCEFVSSPSPASSFLHPWFNLLSSLPQSVCECKFRCLIHCQQTSWQMVSTETWKGRKASSSDQKQFLRRWQATP